MTKFTIEYRRTVRIAPYETLAVGLTEEFDQDIITQFSAFEVVRNTVDYWVEEERDRLKAKTEMEKNGSARNDTKPRKGV
jgi:hypothetical protein